MKNQNKPENNSATESRQSSKKKRKWKKPELIEEDYRNTEQDPGLPNAPGQAQST